MSAKANGKPHQDAVTKRNLFKEQDIRTFINAAGTLTFMSGCLMQDEVVNTISNTSKNFCMLDEV
jgi:hypothetical protein